MNNFIVEIYNHERKGWENYSKRAVFPLLEAQMLDEQLNEGELELKRVKKEYFQPNTIVRITKINTPPAKFSALSFARIKARANSNVSITYNSDGTITQRQERFYLVANDTAIEKPIGSELYDHKIYIIEPTKIMEGFIGDSITFTNLLGNNYIGNP